MTPDSRETAALLSVVESRLGLHFDSSRQHEALAAVCERIDATGTTPAAYIQLLGEPTDAAHDELAVLARALTVGETYFFRHNGQLRAMAEMAVPDLVASRPPGEKLRILSAGCATGEEPHSIAIVLRETGSTLRPVEITGTDINRAAIAAAREGLYSSWSLRATSESLREKYFRTERGRYRLDDGIRRQVRFVEANLTRDEDPLWTAAPAWDVVFCRNVTIYFASDTVQRVLRRLAAAMRPGGYLFLGHAETLRGTAVASMFRLNHTHDSFYYQRLADSEAPRMVVPPVPAGGGAAQEAPARLSPTGAGSGAWHDVVADVSSRIASLADRAIGNRSASAPSRSPSPPLSERSAATGRSVDSALADMRTQIAALRNEEAIRTAQSLADDVRLAPAVQLLLALALTNSGDRTGAAAALDRSDPRNQDPLACYLRAVLLAAAGDTPAACDMAETATWLDGTFAIAHQLHGRLRLQAGDADRGRDALRRALALMPFELGERVRLLGGGFSREQLIRACEGELDRATERTR